MSIKNIGISYALGIATALLGSQLVVSDDPPRGNLTSINPSILPQDEGEKVILSLERDQSGGLVLKHEHHAVLAYGMASVPIIKD